MVVLSYFVVAAVSYQSSIYSSVAEIMITFTIYFLFQGLMFFIMGYFGLDTILYLVSSELANLCELYGYFCIEYGILEIKPGSEEFNAVSNEEAIAATSFSTDSFDFWA